MSIKMPNRDINMERFAHDVCVHVLEKFGIFKAPDDSRKPNKYMNYDFLPCVSRSVVSYSFWIRDSFRKVLENRYKTVDSSNKGNIWDFFDDYVLRNEIFTKRDFAGRVCLSLAFCTEYIQFVSTKDFSVSLNKLVTRWSEFFERNLRENFEAEGGFIELHSKLKSSRLDQIDNFHKAFISEYCLPYGARECTTELAKKCAEEHGIPVHIAIFGDKTTDFIEKFYVGISTEQSESKRSEKSQTEREESKPEETRSDSVGSSGNTDTSEKTDSEIIQNNLLGIPPHEDMLREIDPFFVDNIPSPPKPRSSSKSPERQPASGDAPRSSSKSPERKSGSSDSSESSPEQDLQEKMEHILSKLEHDMEELKTLLLENGLISKKSSRKGRKMRTKDSVDKNSPRGPEGVI